MSMSNQGIEVAVDKFVLELFGFHNERLIGEAGEEQQRKEIRRMLGFAQPHLQAAFIEKLEGEEAVEAARQAHAKKGNELWNLHGKSRWGTAADADEQARAALQAAIKQAREVEGGGS